jgi:hypothetical protein
MMTNWKGFGTGGCDLILGHCPSIRLERLRQTKKNLIRISGRGPRIEPETYRIRSRSVNYPTTTFGSNIECAFNDIVLRVR